MSRNIEQLIDLYFDGQMSAAEQTDFLRLVDADPVLQQLVEAEQFIRGTLGADVTTIPQVTVEPGAHLLSKLESSHQFAHSSNVVQQAAEQTVQSSIGSTSGSIATKVGLKGIAAAGKGVIGAGMVKVAAGVLTVAGLSAGVYFASNTEPLPKETFMGDTAIMRTLTMPPVVADTPVVVQAQEDPRTEAPRSSEKVEEPSSIAATPAFTMDDLKNDLKKGPRIEDKDTARFGVSVKAGKGR